MNSYFDDEVAQTGSTQPTATATATASTPGLTDDDIDKDLSMLFDKANGKKDATPAFAKPTPAATPAPKEKPVTSADDAISMWNNSIKDNAEPAKTESPKVEETKKEADTSPAPSTDWSPKSDFSFKDSEKPAAKISSGGSLAETESKLKDRQSDLNKQIGDLQGKLKKIDDMLGKISELRTKEAELLKSAQEI